MIPVFPELRYFYYPPQRMLAFFNSSLPDCDISAVNPFAIPLFPWNKLARNFSSFNFFPR